MTKITLYRADGIAVVTLCAPPMNALDAPLLEELAQLITGLAADTTVRAAVITGEGRAFSAGLDLKSAPTLDRIGQQRLVTALNNAFGTLYAWPKPLVAAIQGHAIAGGLIMALCADGRVAADVPMQISLAEVRVGVTYPVSPLEIARAELSAAVSRRLVLLGESLDAAAAERLGVVDQRVPADDLIEAALARAARHAQLPPLAFATTKRELRAGALARIDAARVGHGEPRLESWLGDEMRRAAAAAVGSASRPSNEAVRHGA